MGLEDGNTLIQNQYEGVNLNATSETRRIIEAEGGICEAVAGNVSHTEDVAAMVDACIAAFGRIRPLHNNVGIVGRRSGRDLRGELGPGQRRQPGEPVPDLHACASAYGAAR